MTGPSDRDAQRDVRVDVTEVLIRYATAIDRRDWALLRSCFTDDLVADYGPIGAWRGPDEITDWMRRTHEPCGHTLHRITNVAVTAHDDGASARCYVDALVMVAGNRSGTRGVGFYDDELVATEDGWRIARRHFTLVALQSIPESELVALGPVTS
jgi:3-phenylpropionate/cinnamic acid dioxygenase small subunit